MDNKAIQFLKDYRDSVDATSEARSGYGVEVNQAIAYQEILERNIDEYLAKLKDSK